MTRKRITNPVSPEALQRREATAVADLDDAKIQVATENAAAVARSGYSTARDTANQLLARSQLMNGLARVLDATRLAEIKRLKDEGHWKCLVKQNLQLPDGRWINIEGWESFCTEILGYSKSKIEEDLQNLEAFGNNALDAMQLAGIGIRDRRALRKLPDDDLQALRGEIEGNAGNPDAILATVQEVLAVRRKQEATLESRVAGLQEEVDRKKEEIDRMAADNREKINKLADALDRWEALSPDERAVELARDLEEATSQTLEHFLKPQSVINKIIAWNDAPPHLQGACVPALRRLAREAQRIADELGLAWGDTNDYVAEADFRALVEGHQKTHP
ncbi:MAG TPA: hypothetical protein PKZ35_13425 [Gammaproteobacteria bacterium]|nr:hypothetical protein [Chromatiaceae bacterium]HPE80992.1 hypothetical protein [Gammaproteobacteria bacterium]